MFSWYSSGGSELFRNRAGTPAALQLLHLVLHQRDQRRDDHRQPVEQQRRDLVAQRLAAAGGHDRQRIAPGQHVLDHLALERAEGVVAEGVFEDGGGCGHNGLLTVAEFINTKKTMEQ